MKWHSQSVYFGAAGFILAGLIVYRSAVGHDPLHAGSPAQTQKSADPWARIWAERAFAKEGLARDVIAGRLSLLQAAAAFRDLGAEGPPDYVQAAFPKASSEDEAYCRSVIAHVYSITPPDGAKEAACLLESELYARLQDGTLHLPDGP